MDSQVKLYRDTVLTIMNSGRGEIPLQVEEQVCVCVCAWGGGQLGEGAPPVINYSEVVVGRECVLLLKLCCNLQI